MEEMQVATETRLQHLVDMCCSWLQTAPKPNPTLLRLPRAWQNRPDQIYPSAFCLIRQMLQGILNWDYSDQFFAVGVPRCKPVHILHTGIVSQNCDRSCCWCHLQPDLMKRRCIPRIAGPRMDSRSPVTTQ